jgi:hypothetical protein
MATIVMSSVQVIAAANATIEQIKAERKRRNDEVIATAMKLRKVWFKWKTRTKEEAIAWLDKNDAWGWRSGYAWGDEIKAKNLLRLAQHGDPVTLNEDDVRVLF